MDAAIIRMVERARLSGRVSTPTLYIRKMFSQFLFDPYRTAPPPITLERVGEQPIAGLAMAVVQNTRPWTFVGGRAVSACPDASFDTGLDVMGLTALNLATTARTSARLLAQHSVGDARNTVVLHDLEEFTLRSARPLAFQVDGDYLGEREKVTFSSVPDAIRVFC
jgi:diacylglycerol kinase family enzyme